MKKSLTKKCQSGKRRSPKTGRCILIKNKRKSSKKSSKRKSKRSSKKKSSKRKSKKSSKKKYSKRKSSKKKSKRISKPKKKSSKHKSKPKKKSKSVKKQSKVRANKSIKKKSVEKSNNKSSDKSSGSNKDYFFALKITLQHDSTSNINVPSNLKESVFKTCKKLIKLALNNYGIKSYSITQKYLSTLHVFVKIKKDDVKNEDHLTEIKLALNDLDDDGNYPIGDKDYLIESKISSFKK